MFQGRVGPALSSHLTQEINGSFLHTDHQSVPLQGQCWSFKPFPSLYTWIILLISPLNFPTFVTGLGPELEELMVEGFLLQVTLPETEQLYRYLLYKLSPPPSHSSPCGTNTEPDQPPQRGSPQHNKVTTKHSRITCSESHGSFCDIYPAETWIKKGFLYFYFIKIGCKKHITKNVYLNNVIYIFFISLYISNEIVLVKGKSESSVSGSSSKSWPRYSVLSSLKRTMVNSYYYWKKRKTKTHCLPQITWLKYTLAYIT